MDDNPDNGSTLPMGELREISLLIPGEHFFCECITFGEEIADENLEGLAIQMLSHDNFSPYPVDQLAWGFFTCMESRKLIVFATPIAKLRNLGWQNLELFRRVFPSFVSLFGANFENPTIRFLLYDESLTVASFEKSCQVPSSIFSLPVDSSDRESMESVRSKLLALVNLEAFEVETDILVLEEFSRTKEGFFKFEHRWLEGNDPSLELDQTIMLPANELWKVDVRPPLFKDTEQKRRRLSRLRWTAMVSWGIGMAATIILLAGVSYLRLIAESKTAEASRMFSEVPKVRDDQRLLEKLRQNKLGGIDVFGALGRLSVHRGSSQSGPDLWFSEAHFESRNEVKLEGEGKNVEAINTFIENLEINGVATIRRNRSGEEIREIESDGGKTTFEIEFNLIEEVSNPGSSEKPLASGEGEG